MPDTSPDFESQVFFEAQQGLPRQGPGGRESTLQALGMLKELPSSPRILDIGCGPGLQTLALAESTKGSLTAVDLHQSFLDELSSSAAAAGLSDFIQVVNGDMLNLSFNAESFDLIWAEGAIYIAGFQRGLESWKTFLKPGGYIAVTELSWLALNRPKEAVEFWSRDYPDMKSIEHNIAIMEDRQLELIGNFTLPEIDWWKDYYDPLEARLVELREKYSNQAATLERIESCQKEIDLYRNYSESYGYVFYLGRKKSND